jgi:hypothetical protein
MIDGANAQTRLFRNYTALERDGQGKKNTKENEKKKDCKSKMNSARVQSST